MDRSKVKAAIELSGMKNIILNALPKDITNGGVMKLLFKVNPILENQTDIMIVVFPDGFALYVPVEWWNAPYQKGDD